MASGVMSIQDAIKRRVKPLLFQEGLRPIQVRFGLGKGCWLLLDRRYDLQKEFGVYESETRAVYRRGIAAGSVVYDIGAANGDSAIPIANLARGVRVVAFEANPLLCRQLHQNLRLNPSLADQVQVMNCFVAATDGDNDCTVPQCSIDSLSQAGLIPRPHFVKIDVDGAELEVLAGMWRTLTSYAVTVLVEVHSLELEQRCASLLGSIGYTVQIIKTAVWRKLYPEYRPIPHNRWLVARR
jgi:precorrin-6B methylase 2